MRLRDLCDTAYVLQVERLHSHAVALDAWSESKESLPEVMRVAFDEWLDSAVQVPEMSGRSAEVRAALRDLGIEV